MERAIFTMTATPPYDFELTAASATSFRGHYATEIFQDGIYRRLLDLGDNHLCLASVCSSGTVDSPRLQVELTGTALDENIVTEARRQVSWILGTDQDLAPFYCMARQDPMLAVLTREMRGLHLTHTMSVYEALVLIILGQQVHARVARLLCNLLIQTFGPSAEAAGVTYHVFPPPGALLAAGMVGLRSIKFSARKAEYILDIAGRVASGELDLEGLRTCSDEDVIHMLTSIRGVGVWTAQWLLIHALGRPDGFPHNDLALQRTLGILLKGGASLHPEEALEYSRRWSPFRSYVTTYLFAVVRSGRLAILFPAEELGT